MKHIAKHLTSVAMCFLFAHASIAQIYHTESNKVVVGQIGDIVWEPGVHNNYDAQFGTLIAKENRNSNTSRKIGIPVICTEPASRPNQGLPVFVLGGGPGESNLSNTLFFEKIAQFHPTIMVGYRGVDGSSRLNCDYLLNALCDKKLTYENARNTFKAAIDSCMEDWARKLIDIKGYTMQEVVNDIEDVRKSLNYDKIQIVAFSYGTMLAQLYAQQYPEHIDKNVLIAPRLLFDFDIHTSDVADLDSRINEVLAPRSPYIIKRCISAYDSIDQSSSNKEIYMLFTYSNLYSTEGINTLMQLMAQGETGNWNPLESALGKFSTSFSAKMALGDIIAKKQNGTILNTQRRNVPEYAPLSIGVNHWFNPYEYQYIKPTKITANHIPTLIICGNLDIVSSPSVIVRQIAETYKESTSTIIGNCGHTDLLSTQRDTTESAIAKFLDK